MSSAYRTRRTDHSKPSRCVTAAESTALTHHRLPSRVTSQLPFGFRFAAANAGDHVAIRQFLTTVIGPIEDDFAAALDEPSYEPSDRLLIKRGETIVAHVLMRRRVLQLGNIGVPVGQVCELTALPEYRGKGLTAALLQAAEHVMLCDGAVMAVMCATSPDFFRRLGWESYVPYCFSTVGLRSLLRELTESLRSSQGTFFHGNTAPKPNVRPWRQIELNGLISLYDNEISRTACGAWVRSEAHWRWLVNRRDYDQIYVATQNGNLVKSKKAAKRGRPRSGTEIVRPAHVVAYAVLRADHVLELAAHNGESAFSKPLLNRICADAMERGHHEITLHAQPDDPTHSWFRAAGCSTQLVDNLRGVFLLGKVLDAEHLLRVMLPLLTRRVKEKIRDQWHLSMQIGEQRVLLRGSDKRLQVVPNETARNHVTMSPQVFLRLICSQIDTRLATINGELTASTKKAGQRLAGLFCPVPFSWQVWDK